MKKLFLLLFVFSLVCSPAFTQGFSEKFRSEPGQRPPALTGQKIFVTPKIFDLNDNGAPDILSFTATDDLWLLDGKTHETIWEMNLSQTNIEGDKIKYAGFFAMHGDSVKYLATHLLIVTEAEPHFMLSLASTETAQIEWQQQDVSLVAVTDLGKNGQIEIVYDDKTSNQLVVVGWNDGSAGAKEPVSRWPQISSKALELNLAYESEPGVKLAFEGSSVAGIDRFDANGDGSMELIMLVEGSDGEPDGMVVRDGATKEIRWTFQFPDTGPIREDILRGFHGFADLNGDEQPESIFGNRTVVTFDKTIHTLDENLEILALVDLDNNGSDEVIGRGVQDSTLQVWGGSNVATNISENDLLRLGFQLRQNYPNPFNPSTTISYTLESEAIVLLKIFDMQGREIRMLVDERKTAGDHTIEWDGWDDSGRQVASGHYFYQLSTGNRQVSKQLILIR